MVERIKPGTPDGTEENVERLAELFPEVVTEVEDEEGNLERAVDFDALRDLLGDVAEGQRERYQFTWPGKAAAKADARRPVWKTMRPEPERSVDWDTTKNLYIEGDNLDALKLLKETYAGTVDLIYIDPPYNTGSDLLYDDDFVQNREEYNDKSSDYNAAGGRMVANLETSGRFHSRWCKDIYSRLLMARSFLSPKGVIAISIGNNEIENLLKIVSELYSDRNIIPITVQTSGGKPNGGFNISNEYVVFIAPREFEPIPSEEDKKEYASPFHGMNLATFTQLERPNQVYPIFVDNSGAIVGVGKTLQEMMDLGIYTGKAGDYQYDYSLAPNNTVAVWPVTSKGDQCVWRLIPERLMHDWRKGYIQVLPLNNRGKNLYSIQYLSGGIIEQIESGKLKTHRASSDARIPTLVVEDYKTAAATIPTIWTDKKFYTSQGGKQIKELFGRRVFSYPKPCALLLNVAKRTMDSSSIALDFYSGSATLADAVMQLNLSDAGTRRFILVQYPQQCDPDTEAANAGYKTICDIGEERIRRAGKRIAAEVEEANRQLKLGEEPKKVPDIGFRVLRIDTSNMEDTYRTPGETDQMDLLALADNVKLDRTPEDLLFEVLPKFRIPYSARIERRELGGRECFLVDGNRLVACFDTEVGTETIEEMARLEPDYAVMRDASMRDDATQANFEELFKTYSPDTVRRVI